MLRRLVEDICRRKREARITPVLATELELKQELTIRGIRWTAAGFEVAKRGLEARPDIVTRRCLKYSGYEIKRTD